jgi:hypothetical protein
MDSIECCSANFRALPLSPKTNGRRIYIDLAHIPRDVDFVAGHIAYSTLFRRYGSINYLTVLREPISRVLSLWLYWRAMPDDSLARLGAWADYVRRAQEPLKDFLSLGDLACQTDNLSVRMLLWPHRLIPEADFIDRRYDAALLKDALGALKQFAFVDIIENPKMHPSLERWLGRRVPYARISETPHLPLSLAHPLHSELTGLNRGAHAVRFKTMEFACPSARDSTESRDVAVARHLTQCGTTRGAHDHYGHRLTR